MIKLQFACGGNHLEGFQNFDRDCDLEVLPLPFLPDYADFIFCEHAVEHFNSAHAVKLVEDFRRILKPGGTLRLCVPVVGVHLKRDHARDLLTGHGHQIALDRNIAVTLLWAAGFDLPNIAITGRRDIDSHHKVIGKEKDDAESLRIEARK